MKGVLACVFIWITTIELASAQPLSQPEKQFYFFKVWNYVKYYHPSLAGESLNADTLFLQHVNDVDKIKNVSEFNLFITSFLDGLGVSEGKKTERKITGKLLTKNVDKAWFRANGLFNPATIKRLDAVFVNRYRDSLHHYVPDLRYNAEIPNEAPYSYPDSINITYPLRMLCLAKIQGAVDYLYPHKYLMDKNFDLVVKQNIPVFAACKTRMEYEMALLETVATLNDTHTLKFINELKYKSKIFKNNFFPPFTYSVFPDRIVITDLIIPELCTLAGIKTGDQIMEVNGEKVSALVTRIATRVPVSNRPTLLYRLSDYPNNLLWSSETKEFSLVVNKGGKLNNTNIDFIFKGDQENLKLLNDYLGKKNAKLRHDKDLDMVEGDIVRFKIRETSRFIDDIDDSRMDEVLDSLLSIAAKQRGIIFDMREYPDWPGFIYTYILKKFAKQPNRFADYYEANKSEIGTYIVNSDPGTYNNADITKSGTPYTGRVVIIVSPETLSQSEWQTMSLQSIFPQSITIGEQSAGADGDEKILMLPGGYPLHFTGNAIFYRNGTNAQRRGVRIDRVYPLTPASVVSPQDELLDEAIKLIKKRGHTSYIQVTCTLIIKC